jgi:predicted TIM-barrel fold metal-dependent hydrolase
MFQFSEASGFGAYHKDQVAHEQWLAKALPEETLEPDLPCIDAHHHIWDFNANRPHVARFMMEEIAKDIAQSGHNITHTCYMQSSSAGWKRSSGPEELRVAGESEFAQGIAVQAESGKYGKTLVCAGIVSTANMLLGEDIEPVLEEHMQVSRNFRGLRFCGGKAETILFGDARFLATLACMERRGLVFDCNGPETHPMDFQGVLGGLADVAEALPKLKIVVNHCGGAIGPTSIASDPTKREEWEAGLQRLASFPNVYMKVGGLQMPLNGFNTGPPHAERPLTSEELCDATYDLYSCTIRTFGAHRCMWESNFPVDKWGTNYKNLWNAFKRIAARMELTPPEKRAIFHGTAEKVYRLAKCAL